jgi:hypothetical protein
MPGSGRRRLARAAVLVIAFTAEAPRVLAQAQPYQPKNGILSWKAVLLGGGFRVTPAVPLHGNFSKFDHVEIVRAESLIGKDVPGKVLDQLTAGLAKEFRDGGYLAGVSIVPTADLQATPPAPAASPAERSFRDADPIDAPMRTWDDLLRFDRLRHEAAAQQASAGTLVVRCQVIDYSKGNKFLQLLFIDLGNSLLTIRVSYYDQATGEELGSSVISSDNSSSVIPSAVSMRTALTGVIGGLVDQVTRRKLAGER